MSCLKFSILFCALFLTSILKAQVEDCAGVITGLRGNIQVRKVQTGSLMKAYWGFQLFSGDKVITADDSEVIITLPDNTVLKIGPGSSLILSSNNYKDEEPVQFKKISSASLINLEVLTSRQNTSEESGALAGFRSFGAEKLFFPEAPYNTMIRTVRPTFLWNTNEFFNFYKISLSDNSGVIWEKKVSGTILTFPENEKDLIRGESYSWNIEAGELPEIKKSDMFKFSIMSEEKSKETDLQENEIRKSLSGEDETSSLHSVLGAFYLNQGLIHEAISEFKTLAEMIPESFLTHEILSSLYNKIGNREKAAEEHRIALSFNDRQP